VVLVSRFRPKLSRRFVRHLKCAWHECACCSRSLCFLFLCLFSGVAFVSSGLLSENISRVDYGVFLLFISVVYCYFLPFFRFSLFAFFFVALFVCIYGLSFFFFLGVFHAR
jgi:hypothetical protein